MFFNLKQIALVLFLGVALVAADPRRGGNDDGNRGGDRGRNGNDDNGRGGRGGGGNRGPGRV
ncbi:hypothetical protein EXIGLDRAFT_761284 [Exidia glandulosa HHB12029]|uniref:Uncharacterized protein n=1 Tax=Exidia glandulosa HHB12029 TaxID=1314781 RepID=A0A165NNR2_EXIGL|nr:hypothetical protein EXIGLDRAFT_761284 [Exidia glandulosa HHB12029]